jgi:hypothetical protein
MKTSMIRTFATLGLCAALGLVSLQAQTRGRIRVSIPFGFTVGSQTMAAGNYEVWQPTQGPVLTIQSADGRSHMTTPTQSGEPNAAPGYAKLTFHKYGERYFLARVSESGRAWELPRTPVEK